MSAYLDIKIPPKIGYAGAVSFILRIDNIYEYTVSLISKAIEAGVHETSDVAEACNKIANHSESCVTVNTFYKIVEVPVLKQQEQQQVSEVFDDSDNFAFNLTNETGINGTNFSSFIQETDGASLEQDQEEEVKSDATNRTKRNNFTLHFTFSVESVNLSSVILKAVNDWKNNEYAISSILLEHNVLDVENASMYEQLVALREAPRHSPVATIEHNGIEGGDIRIKWRNNTNERHLTYTYPGLVKLDTLKLKTAEWKGANFSVFADVLYIPFSSNVEKWLCYKRMAHFAYGEEDQFFSSRIKTTVASSKWRLANFVQIDMNSIGDIHNFTDTLRELV